MRRENHITAVLLAAGSAKRMAGQNKLFLEIAGKSILQHSYENLKQAKPDAIIVVTGDNDGDARTLLKRETQTQVVCCATAARGMSESLKTGVLAAGKKTTGVLIVLADQPLISPQTLAGYLSLAEHGHRLVAGSYGQFFGCPALFHRDYFDQLLALGGDAGARAVLLRHAGELATVKIPAEEALDVDTADDLEVAKKALANRQPGR